LHDVGQREVVIGLENLGMLMNAAVEDLGCLLIKLPLAIESPTRD
jgi:hypothetical protein